MYAKSAIILALGATLPVLTTAQLHDLAVKAGLLYFGTAVDSPSLSNAEYYSILTNTSEFGQLVPSNGQKWQFVEPQQNVFNFTEGHLVTDIAQATGQKLRCHTTVWHSQLAPWVESTTWTKEELLAVVENHVTREITEWKGQCYAWDVLNEALEEDGTYRKSIFFNVTGTDYIKTAFRAAAKADPAAKLYYNDYAIERPTTVKSEGVRQNIIKLLQDDGIRIDGLGMQAHYTVGRSPTYDEQVATMKSYAAYGLDVALTELDVRVQLPLNASNIAAQKEVYKNSTLACLDVKECVGITVWDFYDPVSFHLSLIRDNTLIEANGSTRGSPACSPASAPPFPGPRTSPRNQPTTASSRP
jgi:endo-1,4-beta-xylanase